MDKSPANNQIEPKQRPEFRPYTDKEFTNRANELNLIEEKVRAIQRGRIVFTPLVNFHGIIGIGKSWLITQIYYENERENESISALVNFGNHLRPDSPQARLDALAALVKSMERQMESKGGELYEKWEDLSQAISGDERPPEVVEDFVDFIRLLTDHHIVPILIFDTTEKASDDLFYWLEEQVIERVVRGDKVVAIFAGRERVRFKKFEVRRRVEAVELKPFNQEQTGDQLQKIQQKSPDRRRIYEQLLEALPRGIVEAVLRFSAGHPLTSREVLEKLIDISQQREKEIGDKEALKEILGEIGGVVDRIIDQVILEEAEPKLRAYLRNVFIPRKFNVSHLRFCLRRFENESYAEKADSFYLDLIARMVETKLVRWSSDHRGYILDPIVRKMMANLLREHKEKKDEYIERHQAAIELYDSWITKYPENATSYIIEKLFHRASVMCVRGQKGALGRKLRGELKKVLNEDFVVIDEARSLYEELGGDEELKELIGEEIFDSLVNDVDTFSKNLGSTGG